MTAEEIKDMTVSAIKKKIESTSPPSEELIQVLERDTRLGVQKLALQIRKKQKAQTQEKARLEQLCVLENKLRAKGFIHIAGVDEAGRGPLAGPVIASAVILPPNTTITGIDDSKKLSEQKREELYELIQNRALCVGVGEATPQEIDNLNIRNATHLAMKRALDALTPPPDKVLIDGNAVPESKFSEMAIIGGDRKSISIAAASIIAKVTRDRQMIKYDAEYPAYGFAKHKGYGSAEHLAALQEHGATPVHRHSFAGVPQSTRAFSEDFNIFADGIAEAKDLSQLEAIGHSIATAATDLPPEEVETLRVQFRKKRATLNQPGNKGEALARTHLTQNGFTIIAQNYRAVGGEIDIIAQKADTLAFVEVKTANQDHFDAPQTWVTPQKQNQIIKVARAYLKSHPKSTKAPRFDVVAINLTPHPPQIRHIENAFTQTR